MNMAMTADGKITSAKREYPTFTSADDKKTMDRLRAEADAVLIGAGTMRADDPPLTVSATTRCERTVGPWTSRKL
jgi:riboflavin biosynthesis pyrimidine reductase